MKKMLFKKYDNLVALLIVCLMAVIVPTVTIVYAESGYNPICDDMTKVGSSGWKTDEGPVHNIVPRPADPSNQYAHPTVNTSIEEAGGATIHIYSDVLGVDFSYDVYPNETILQYAKDNGLCSTPCILAKDAGLAGDRTTWSSQIEAAGAGEVGDGKNFSYDNAYSLWKAKETLKRVGYHVDEMSQSEIETIASEIAHENGSFVASDYKRNTIVKDMKTQESFICYGASSQKCMDAINENFAIYIEDDAAASKAGTNDTGSICKGDDCPPGGNGDDDDDTPPEKFYLDKAGEVVDFEINADSCSLSVPNIPPISPKPIPTSPGQTGGSCGSVAQKVTYSTSTVACGKVVMLTTTTTTAQLPTPSRSSIFAGAGFDWSGVTSVTNVSTRVYDDSALQNEYNAVQTQITAVNSAITCVEQAIAKLTQEYQSQIAACNAQVEANANECKSCQEECGREMGECASNPENDCSGISCSCGACGANVEQQKVCDALTQSYNEQMNALQKQKEGYQSDLASAELQMKELNKCAGQIPSGETSTRSGTVSISNQTMNLSNKYTQAINTVKGIAKNSGLPLTASEIEKLEGETYIGISYNFFVPYYIPNLTSGSLNASINGGGISIPNYSCPITVYNTVKCDPGTGCDLNIIYRPISLTDPFPNTISGSEYRQMGSNWSEFSAFNFIKKNRNVNDYEVYKTTPLYTITLTPSTIKDIRNYNKNNSLTDFNMRCNNGYRCISSFIWDEFSSIVDTSNSCASSTGWDEECYYGGVTE